jgi:hypothetical protein
MEKLRTKKLAGLDITQENHIIQALDGLYHDEHIHAALQLNVISQAFIIQHSFDSIDPLLSQKGMQVLPTEINFKESTQIEQQDYFNSVLDSDFLNRQLNQWKKHTPSFDHENMNYILDIDLDVFKSHQSMNPDCCKTFYQLIQRAHGITIAKESEWIQRLKTDNNLNSDQLLKSLLKHLQHALY